MGVGVGVGTRSDQVQESLEQTLLPLQGCLPAYLPLG